MLTMNWAALKTFAVQGPAPEDTADQYGHRLKGGSDRQPAIEQRGKGERRRKRSRRCSRSDPG